MTDTTETLDTLIDHWRGQDYVDGYNAAMEALTDLRTERDAALAVLARNSTYDEALMLAVDRQLDGSTTADELVEAAENWRNADRNATAPTTALADRDARILEEAAEVCRAYSSAGGHTQHVADILDERAASRRAEAHEGDSTSHDSGSSS